MSIIINIFLASSHFEKIGFTANRKRNAMLQSRRCDIFDKQMGYHNQRL